MKIGLQFLLSVFMAMAMSGCASAPSHKQIPPFDYSLLDVVIPHIRLENATIEQAVETIQKEWRNQRGITDKQMPLAVVIDYIHRDEKGMVHEGYPGYRKTITFEANQISVKECLEMVSRIGGQRLRIRSGNLIFETVPWIEEDYVSQLVPVSKKGQTFFKLTSSTTPDELSALLRRYGIRFREGLAAKWVPEFERIMITNIPHENSKLIGLLWLIDNGYEIKKAAQPKPDGDGLEPAP